MTVSIPFESHCDVGAENGIALVPILDARKIKLTTALFKNAVKMLPVYDRTVPMDSLLLVCYTNTSYVKDGVFSANHNLLWAAVLCGKNLSVVSLPAYGLTNYAHLDSKPLQFQSLFHDDDLYMMLADRVQPRAMLLD
jgi:hypothetical protein